MARTIMIDGRLLGYRAGGIQRYVLSLAYEFARSAAEFQVTVLVNRRGAATALPATRVLTPPHHRLERLALGIEVSLRRPALLHSADFIAPAVYRAARIVTIHDLAFLDDPALLDDASRRYYGAVERTVREVDAIIAVSGTTARRVIEELGADPRRVRTIYNGVDPAIAACSAEAAVRRLRGELDAGTARRLLGERPIVLAVGTIEPRKRYDLMLAAVRRLIARGGRPAPLLVIVGQTGWRCDDTLARIAEAVNQGEVIWLPWVSDHALAALYQLARLLVITSRDEGFGLPAAEAMASGCPVLAASRGALPEILDGAGVLVESDDPETWAAELAALLQDDERRAGMRERGRRRAGQFRWEHTARQTLELYREVLSR